MPVSESFDTITPFTAGRTGVTIPAWDKGGAVFNVKAFGAVGTGNASDAAANTAAIQAAFNAAAAVTAFLATSGSLTGQYVGSAPAVFFPAGHYKINGEINGGAYMQVIADGAILEQTDPTKRHLVCPAFTVEVVGMKFLGGLRALDFRNENSNGSYIRVLHCEFQLTREFAIYTLGTGPEDDHMSANLTISQCKFFHCRQVLHNVCDNARVEDCWVQVSKDNFAANTAAFVNKRGILRFDSMFGVPTMGAGAGRLAGVRWVDLEDGDFYATDSRFGGEDAGMAVVYVTKPEAPAKSQANNYPWVGSAVTIVRSWVLSGESGRADSGVIHLRTSVPQSITYEDNLFTLNPLIVNSGNVNLDTYFDPPSPPAPVPPSEQQRWRFTVPGVPVGLPAGIPGQLLPFTNFIDYSRRADAIPTNGRWTKGQTLERLTPAFGKPMGMACVANGEPGSWAEYGKLSPFPVGPQVASAVVGNKAKVSFPIRVKCFVAIVTVSTNPNPEGSGNYRTIRSDVISLTTGWSGTVKDYLFATPLSAPTTPGGVGLTMPTVASVHFGTGDTGSSDRAAETNPAGDFTVVYNGCMGPTHVTVELLHAGP